MTPLESLQAEWDQWMDDTGHTGKRTQGAAWRRDNPGEWAKLAAYRGGTGSRPDLVTTTGKQMVYHVDAYLALKNYVPPLPPEPVKPVPTPVPADIADKFVVSIHGSMELIQNQWLAEGVFISYRG